MSTVTIEYQLALRAAFALDGEVREFRGCRARAIERGDLSLSAKFYEYLLEAKADAQRLRAAKPVW